MNAWLISLIIIATIIIASFGRSIYELYHLEVSHYNLKSKKLNADERLRIVFISDLHGRKYGSDNEKLKTLISKENPDIILIGGDMFNASSGNKDSTGLSCVKALVKIAPVYYALGNHEGLVKFLGGYGSHFDEERLGRYYSKRLQSHGESDFSKRWNSFKAKTSEAGIKLLDNETCTLPGFGNVCVTGLTLPVVCYKKRHPEPVTEKIIDACIGKIAQNRYNILLAHSPEFFEEYADTGADLILSGHLHGGIMRIPGLGGVISPKMKLFPEYSFGRFEKKNCVLIVTKGSGSHHINIRLFNKPEIVSIDIRADI